MHVHSLEHRGMNTTFPQLQALRNPHLASRHYERLALLVGMRIDQDDLCHLEDLISRTVISQRDAILAISEEATQEASLEAMLRKVYDRWATLTSRQVRLRTRAKERDRCSCAHVMPPAIFLVPSTCPHLEGDRSTYCGRTIH